MNRESEGRGHAEGAGRDTTQALDSLRWWDSSGGYRLNPSVLREVGS